MSESDDCVWQDKEIRFDCPRRDLVLRGGEQRLARCATVEDTRGNPGLPGLLVLTNLRLIWVNPKDTRVNLSIGLSVITDVAMDPPQMTIHAHFGDNYQFLFSNLSDDDNNLIFQATATARHIHASTKAYRELRLRTMLLREKVFVLLPKESLYSTLPGVWNLSGDQGSLGVMVITNVRVAWYAALNELLNVSIPYVVMNQCAVVESKYGRALVIETVPSAGSFAFGFRIEGDRLDRVASEVASLHQLAIRSPHFGLDADALSAALEAVADDAADEDPLPEDLSVDADTGFGALKPYLLDPGPSLGRACRTPVSCALVHTHLPCGTRAAQLASIRRTSAELSPRAPPPHRRIPKLR